jgi:hypothetical protein
VGRNEHTLEVGTVNADKGCAEPGSVGTPLGYRKCRNAVALSPSPPNQFARFCGKGSDVIKTPEARKFSRSVGGQTHGRTNFSQLGGLFINIGGQPPLAQRKSKRQATNTAANNADTNLGPCHRESLREILNEVNRCWASALILRLMAGARWLLNLGPCVLTRDPNQKIPSVWHCTCGASPVDGRLSVPRVTANS